MKEIKLVIFDMDGLMFDTEVLVKRAWREIGEKNNYDITMDFLKSLLGLNKISIGKRFRETFGEDFPFEKFHLEHHEIADRIIEKEGLGIKKGLIELLNFLDERSIKKAVATSSNRNRAEKLLNTAGILERFDTVLCGDEVSNGKPDPEIFLNVCKKVGIKPEEAIVLEDSEMGLKASVAGGIKCIIVPDLVEPSEENSGLAYGVLKNLEEVIKLFI